MPTVREIAMDVEEPSEGSLQVSTTSPEQAVVPSVPPRALHVKKSNTKQSADSSSRSSSARSSSRPPSGTSSHRGPGAVALTRTQTNELHLHDERSVQQTVVHNQDQRMFVHHQDQRSMQVTIGVDPDAVIAREAHIMSEAHAVVNAARSQVETMQYEAQAHSQGVEHRATLIVNELQANHQKELAQVQDVAQHAFNEAQQAMLESQQRLQMSENRNRELTSMIESQAQLLESQKEEHQALMSQVAMLQNEITTLRHSSIPQTVQTQDQNGAVHIQGLMKMVSTLRNEVEIMKSYMSPPASKGKAKKGNITPPMVEYQGVALSPGHQSACAGYPSSQEPSPVNWKMPESIPDVPRLPVKTYSINTTPSAIAPPPGPPSNPFSSSSSSDDSPSGNGGGGYPGSPQFDNSGRNRMSVGVGSSALGFMAEKDVYRSKDLALIKLESLPTSASEFQSWKNTFLTRVASIDQTGLDVVLQWLVIPFEEGRALSEFVNSGLLPRLDSHLGSLLMDSKHLKGELGMKFQTYAESCQAARHAPRGRAFLFMIAQHFRLDLNRGSNLTQQTLLDLQPDGFTPKEIERFVERIEYVLNGIPPTHQPSEITKFTWLYSHVKRCKLLQRHIDRIRDSHETSHVRTWDWLMGKIKSMLIEVREDQNEESIRAALQPKPKQQPPPKAALAAPSQDPKRVKADDGKGTFKEEGTKGLPSPPAKAKPKAKDKPKPDGAKGANPAKGGGKGKEKEKKADSVKTEACR